MLEIIRKLLLGYQKSIEALVEEIKKLLEK